MIKGQKDYVTPKQGLILKYKGKFDFKNLYNTSKEWFKKNNYIFTEKEYKEKYSSIGTEFRIVFDGERKIDDYSSFHISFQIYTSNAVKTDGKYSGNLHMTVLAYILLDRKNKWQYSPLKSFLFFFYNNIIIFNKIKNVYEDKLLEELAELVNNIKKYSNLK